MMEAEHSEEGRQSVPITAKPALMNPFSAKGTPIADRRRWGHRHGDPLSGKGMSGTIPLIS